MSTVWAPVGELQVELHSFLDGGLVSISIPDRFTSGKEAGTCWIGGRVWLDVLEKRKYLLMVTGFELRTAER